MWSLFCDVDLHLENKQLSNVQWQILRAGEGMLQMEDWEILNDPFTVRIKKLKFAIDLEVRKGNVTALVEIKSFLNKGFLEDF